jgi:hypothetical protein
MARLPAINRLHIPDMTSQADGNLIAAAVFDQFLYPHLSFRPLIVTAAAAAAAADIVYVD